MLTKTGLLWAACVCAPWALAQPALEKIRQDWRARRYPETYEATEQYRRQPYGKQLEIYYMGGTSLCRIQGRADLGALYMQWILDNFWLTRQAGDIVKSELQSCRNAASPPVLIAFNTTLATAGSSGRTKMFYATGGKNAIRSVPVQVVKEIPEEELRKRLFSPGETEQATAAVKRLAGAGAEAAASKHFVVAGRQREAAELQAIGQRLDTVYDFFLLEYGMRPPEHLISVYLTADADGMRTRSRALHGIELSPQSIGYSYQSDMSMVGIIPGQQIGTLQHELFHLMVRNDFGDIPPWLDEGMAALYEVTETRGARVVGVPNWRGPVLKELWSQQPETGRLVKMNWLEFNGGDRDYETEGQAANHAKARHLIMYLQDEGKLRDVYRAFQSRKIGSDPVVVLRGALHTDTGMLEGRFQEWFRSTIH